jgi:hypothetical protein
MPVELLMPHFNRGGAGPENAVLGRFGHNIATMVY